MLKIPHCSDNRLTDEVRWSDLRAFFLFLVLISVRGSEIQGLVRLEGLGKLKKIIYLIGPRTRDLSACSIVAQPTTHSQNILGNIELSLLKNVNTDSKSLPK
jgi:hypothetical protein